MEELQHEGTKTTLHKPLKPFLTNIVPQVVRITGFKLIRQRRELNSEHQSLDDCSSPWKFWKIGVRNNSISFFSWFFKESIIEAALYLVFGEKSAQQWEECVPRSGDQGERVWNECLYCHFSKNCSSADHIVLGRTSYRITHYNALPS